MNVFIGGSRAVSKLNAIIRARINDLMARQCTILIGDANGADKAVQQYLAKQEYSHVIIFCMEDCRNNIGSWPVRKISAPSTRKDFSYYAAKDFAMAHEAKCGVMLWDGKSKGTLQNMLNLIRSGKRTLVYCAPVKEFFVLTSDHDLHELLARCDKGHIETAMRGLGLEGTLNQPLLDLRTRH